MKKAIEGWINRPPVLVERPPDCLPLRIRVEVQRWHLVWGRAWRRGGTSTAFLMCCMSLLKPPLDLSGIEVSPVPQITVHGRTAHGKTLSTPEKTRANL